MNPQFPVYIISKGRWESRMTARELDRIGVPYHIVVEPQELEAYAEHIHRSKILVLPFSNLGQGSIPARNWVWQHAIDQGAARHWIMDDNLRRIYRLNRNQMVPVGSGTVLRAAEDFVLRYENVPLAGLQYSVFVHRNDVVPPFRPNTRVYSCILIDNALHLPDGERWRGRYNEDTDLSLRVLKAGHCTILFNAFLVDKTATMTMGGGNTDELYAEDGRLKMAKSLVDQHPDVVKIVHKWDRWQHSVDYRPFRGNQFRLKSKSKPPEGANEYGMVLRQAGHPSGTPAAMKRPEDTQCANGEVTRSG